MTHRVHTILSLLAEDHAPAALRPSILLAVDWPTVAAEAPATGDDASAASLAAGLLCNASDWEGHHGVISRSAFAVLASLAARLATVAASLTVTGDKDTAAHATALWGAAAALVGLPTTTTESSTASAYLCALANKASDMMDHPGDISTAAKQATLVATALDKALAYLRALAHKANGLMFGMSSTPAQQAAIIGTVLDKIKAHEFVDHEQRRAAHDRALADIHALRDILKVPEGGNLVDHASRLMSEFPRGLLTTCATAAAKITGTPTTVFPAEQAGLIGDALRLHERVSARLDAAIKERDAATAENARLRAQVDRMIAAVREDAPPAKAEDLFHVNAVGKNFTFTVKPAKPQPGDQVPWAEVEDGCLYYREPINGHARGFLFRMVVGGMGLIMHGPEDSDVVLMLQRARGVPIQNIPAAEDESHCGVLVARDLGADPEAWRKAMREWTANGNKPSADVRPIPGDEDWRNGATGRVR